MLTTRCVFCATDMAEAYPRSRFRECMSKAAQPHKWRISLIRAKADLLGYVEAPDEAAAFRKAIEQFRLTDEQGKRLIVQRV